MFDNEFKVRYINHQKQSRNGVQSIWHNYSFTGNKKRYIVIAEEFDYMIFAVKFYLKEHASCEHKFNRLTNQKECSRVIKTVGSIITDIYSKNPYASFAFVGSPSKDESVSNTKRYKLYSKVVSYFIGPSDFEHKYSDKHSAYLILNRSNDEIDLMGKIERMFLPLLPLS